MFQGFSQQAVDFLWGIRLNNERSWFLAHKQEYLTYVAQPLRELGEEVHQAMEEYAPQLGLNLHVSRIYRDARRLHGRGPYKDHLWFTLRRPKEQWVSLPAFYFEIAPEYYSFGMGCYDPTPVTMAKLRARIGPRGTRVLCSPPGITERASPSPGTRTARGFCSGLSWPERWPMDFGSSSRTTTISWRWRAIRRPSRDKKQDVPMGTSCFLQEIFKELAK